MVANVPSKAYVEDASIFLTIIVVNIFCFTGIEYKLSERKNSETFVYNSNSKSVESNFCVKGRRLV